MELTKKLLENKITYVCTQGANAANIVQQAVGAELILRELLQEVELREAVEAATPDDTGGMDGLSE